MKLSLTILGRIAIRSALVPFGQLAPAAAPPATVDLAASQVAAHRTVASDLAPAVWHFKDRRPLSFDRSRIAFFDPTATDEAEARARIAAAEIGEPVLSPCPIPGWWILDIADRGEDPNGIVSLTKHLATAIPSAFITPVFQGNHDAVLAVSPWLLVRFAGTVNDAAGRATLAQVRAGDILEASFGGLTRAYRVRTRCAHAFEVLALAESLARRSDVVFAEPDMVSTGTHAFLPNDAEFAQCWGLHNTGQFGGVAGRDIDAPEAWDFTTGSLIALVIDNGVQQNHPDINQIPGFDATGQDVGGGPGNPCDNHGTAVAGIISARIDNALGIVGVAPDVKVASARATISRVPCDDGSWMSMDSWVVNALAYGESVGARVTCNSTGYWASSSAVEAKYAETRLGGMVHFAAAGNGGADHIGDPVIDYLAGLPGVNAVGALAPDGLRAPFSNFGAGLAYSAPGMHIYTTDRTGSDGASSDDYALFYGTSAATPFAAGVAALVLSWDPTLSPVQVERILSEGCTHPGLPGFDPEYGWGFVNAFNSVTRALASPAWRLREAGGPPARAHHAAAYDSVRGETIIFGGGMPLRNDTWKWNGIRWRYLSGAAPSPRVGAGMAFDSARGVAVLFGGWDSDGADGETWEWNGAAWTERFAPISPSPRGGHAMAYDSARGVTVLFGGAEEAGSFNDETWEWNGTVWTHRVALNRPSPRGLHAMAYDVDRAVSVLFGGKTSFAQDAQDGETWEWNGITWSRRLEPGPAPRQSHAMAYDVGRGAVVLFGGSRHQAGSGPAVLQDTWEWNGLFWRQPAGGPAPPPRALHTLAYDGRRRKVVVFGGQGQSADERNDTWEYETFSGPDFDADGSIDRKDLPRRLRLR